MVDNDDILSLNIVINYNESKGKADSDNALILKNKEQIDFDDLTKFEKTTLLYTLLSLFSKYQSKVLDEYEDA
jgi:hypothetical protein